MAAWGWMAMDQWCDLNYYFFLVEVVWVCCVLKMGNGRWMVKVQEGHKMGRKFMDGPCWCFSSKLDIGSMMDPYSTNFSYFFSIIIYDKKKVLLFLIFSFHDLSEYCASRVYYMYDKNWGNGVWNEEPYNNFFFFKKTEIYRQRQWIYNYILAGFVLYVP